MLKAETLAQEEDKWQNIYNIKSVSWHSQNVQIKRELLIKIPRDDQYYPVDTPKTLILAK